MLLVALVLCPQNMKGKSAQNFSPRFSQRFSRQNLSVQSPTFSPNVHSAVARWEPQSVSHVYRNALPLCPAMLSPLDSLGTRTRGL